MNNRIPVVIIGAGPTGLMMACELARHHIPFRIVDKHPERTLTANAVGIQTRTLEILDNIGIVQQFLKLGHPCQGIQIHAEGKALASISFADLDSFYHYILMLPQSETERLLIEHLAHSKQEVERPLEIMHLQEKDDSVICTLQNPEGKVEIIESNWLIACDGANSTVRNLCNIDFPGEDVAEQCMVANAEMSSFLSTTDVQVFLGKGTVLIALPFGSHRYRVSVNLHQHPRKFLIEKEVKEMVQERSQGSFDVNNVSWISPFWIHSKIAPQLRQRCIFLAGDAAHIHSPFDAQGMNTGMQDAYNLAWKLALVVKGKAKPSILESYHEERYPIVHDIINHAERFMALATQENPLLAPLKQLIFRVLNHKKVSNRLTQLSLRYKKSAIIDYHHQVSAKSPRPGERAPDVIIHTSLRLHDYLKEAQHHILLFTGLAPTADIISKIKALQQNLNKRYPGLVKTYCIAEKKIADIDHFIWDEQAVIHQRYGVKTPALFIIRPDDYLACCSKIITLQTVEECLGRYLT